LAIRTKEREEEREEKREEKREEDYLKHTPEYKKKKAKTDPKIRKTRKQR
jgi:hypothetical protein